MKDHFNKTSYDVEHDVDMIAEEIARDRKLPNDFYGDRWPDEVVNIMNSKYHYIYCLDEVKRVLDLYADTYIDLKRLGVIK